MRLSFPGSISVPVLILLLSACNTLRSVEPIITVINTPSVAQMPAKSSIPSIPTPQLMKEITLENAGSLETLAVLEIPNYIKGQISQCSLAFSPDGGLLVGACGRNQVPVWDTKSGKVLHLLYDGNQQIVACAFHPYVMILACGGFDREVTLWDPRTGVMIKSLGSHDSPVWDLNYSPDGTLLASCSLADDIRVWDWQHGGMLWSNVIPRAYLSVDFDPTGRTIAYGSRWGYIGILDAASGRNVVDPVKLAKPVGDVAFSPAGRILATGTDDNYIYLWNTTDLSQIATLEGHNGYVNGVDFNSQGTLLVSGSHDGKIALWDVAGLKPIKMFAGHHDTVLRVVFSPDNTRIGSISWDGTVRVWGIH
jgi:WD40 repeat protein